MPDYGHGNAPGDGGHTGGDRLAAREGQHNTEASISPGCDMSAGSWVLHGTQGPGVVLAVTGPVVIWQTPEGYQITSHADQLQPTDPETGFELWQTHLHTVINPDGYAPWRAAGGQRCEGGGHG